MLCGKTLAAVPIVTIPMCVGRGGLGLLDLKFAIFLINV